ncbi:hypothetical protein LJR267_010679 [Paraburkholderia hospita]|uniref:hypothetical protein n=1 Tax=Paraburkholderia hospita TaxID=169430 RepID=UPI003ED0675A
MPDTATSAATKSLTDPQWRELCTQLRTTDDISLKLLGFVPLFTAAAITGLLKTESSLSLPLIIACFAGSVSTLGFWIWERRNIQTCEWLRARAADLERVTFGPTYIGQFARFPGAPRHFGKAAAEKIVYAVTVAAWLLFPLSTLSTSCFSNVRAIFILLLLVYAVVTIMIALWALRELTVEITLSPCEPPIWLPPPSIEVWLTSIFEDVRRRSG